MDFSSTKACSLSYFLLPYFFYPHRLTLIVLLQQYVSHTTRADVKVYCVWVPSSIASTFQGPDIIFIYYSIITHLIGCVTRIHFLLEFYNSGQGLLTIGTYHSFFRIYNQGPLLNFEYLQHGLRYQCASFTG